VPNETPITVNRAERILAYMVAASVGLSIAAFLAIIIATAVGVRDFGQSPWPIVFVLPLVGLPIGVGFMIALVVTSAVRRGRDSRDAL